MTTWPSGVPQIVLVAGFGEASEDNVASFNPEVGPPMRRRRTSIATTVFAIASVLTPEEFDDLQEFYHDTLKDGVLPFTRNHPRTGDAGETFKFEGGPPRVTRVMPSHVFVAFSLRQMP